MVFDETADLRDTLLRIAEFFSTSRAGSASRAASARCGRWSCLQQVASGRAIGRDLRRC